MTATGLRLETITRTNVDAVLALRVHPEQEDNVAPVATSLAEAYAYGETAWPRAIYDGEELVGFLMAFLDIEWDGGGLRSGLWRLNIGAAHQGMGYGRFAVRAVGDELRRRGTSRLYVSWHQGEHGPGDFYRRLGFEETGELAGDQAVGLLAI